MRLTKHHALGNDFLVLVDIDGWHTNLAPVARAACDRRRGIGADGLLHLTAGHDGADVTMALYNADGGRAEMSGNGLACLTHAAVHEGLAGPDRVTVSTDSGLRVVEILRSSSDRDSHGDPFHPGVGSVDRLRVEVGPAVLGDELPEWVDGDVLRAVGVDVGNPHVVLHVAEPAKFPIEEVGTRICDLTPGGVNVEAIGSGAAPGELAMVVYERGVGVTEACGTGACAAAAVGARWGLVGDHVRVAMPGGTTEIDVGPTILMTTTIAHVATIDFHSP
ncbi:MAG: diaminopimelate epimerase [Acidimicrobiales bacterium]